MSNMEKLVEELKKSVMFNLSLASKELFHSNFLSFLFEKDKSLFAKIAGLGNFKTETVKREFKHIDIEITGKDGTKYLIENKVKDIIDEKQIKKIEDRFQKGEYAKNFLFSLLGGTLEGLERKPYWEEISYRNIEKVLRKQDFKDELINSMKDDYCRFMCNMITLIEDLFKNCSTYTLFAKNETVEKLKEIRLHDVFMKYGASHFMREFKKINKDSSIETGTFLSNSLAGMDFAKTKKGIRYGIQIQGEQYRKFIISNEKTRNSFAKDGWFNPEWRSPQKLPYCIFTDKKGPDLTFWYQYEKKSMIVDIPYKALAEKIKKDLAFF